MVATDTESVDDGNWQMANAIMGILYTYCWCTRDARDYCYR